MIDGALPYLRCPLCRQTLARQEGTLRCPAGHAFDLAKQGYANLATGRLPYAGDTAEMVADRADFLAAGHYDFIADALAEQLGAETRQPSAETRQPSAETRQPSAETRQPSAETGQQSAKTGQQSAKTGQQSAKTGQQSAKTGREGEMLVDAGTGTGHYLARVLDHVPRATGLGVDVSKAALRRAARSHPRTAAVLADLWGPLPIADASASAILNVFAPRNGAEFRRVLRPGGVLLVVTPAPDHLAELIAAHGLIHVDPDKAERVAGALGEHFTATGTRTLRRTLRLEADQARTLIGMTPSARHMAAAALPAGPRTVTAAVDLTVYR
jgi:23S rRNA (guanine745-N1)-methyltransferase